MGESVSAWHLNRTHEELNSDINNVLLLTVLVYITSVNTFSSLYCENDSTTKNCIYTSVYCYTGPITKPITR